MNPLAQYKRTVTSYQGEDGIIEHVFEVIGTTSKWCVEFGAVDGKSGSNTWNLIKNKGWSAVLIEANPVFFSKLVKEYEGNKEVHTVNAYVSFKGENSLDAILTREGAPDSIDFVSIDIDGADYHVWDALTKRPRVVMIECNLRIPASIKFVQAKDMNVGQGSSLASLVELGKKKGYELIYAGDMNALFVLKEEYPKFGMSGNAPEAIGATVETGATFFQLFDGSIVLTGIPAEDILLYKKKPTQPLYVLDIGKLLPLALQKDSRITRVIKNLLKKVPGYNAFVYPLARKYYGAVWKKKKESLARGE